MHFSWSTRLGNAISHDFLGNDATKEKNKEKILKKKCTRNHNANACVRHISLSFHRGGGGGVR